MTANAEGQGWRDWQKIIDEVTLQRDEWQRRAKEEAQRGNENGKRRLAAEADAERYKAALEEIQNWTAAYASASILLAKIRNRARAALDRAQTTTDVEQAVDQA